MRTLMASLVAASLLAGCATSTPHSESPDLGASPTVESQVVSPTVESPALMPIKPKSST